MATTRRKFSATFILEVEENNNILSSYETHHNEDIRDLIEHLIFDIDDVKAYNINVREH
jgi:hypothetical protein|tara:strand:+ start:6508 stop:6684 length:177 start_codon:yes stop_codon:yes gene_type:complete